MTTTILGLDIGSSYSKIATIHLPKGYTPTPTDPHDIKVITDAEGERLIPSVVARITSEKKGEVSFGTPAHGQWASNIGKTCTAFGTSEDDLTGLDRAIFPHADPTSQVEYFNFLKKCISAKQAPQITIVSVPMYNLRPAWQRAANKLYTIPSAFATCVAYGLENGLVQVVNLGAHFTTSSIVRVRDRAMALVDNQVVKSGSFDLMLAKEILKMDFKKNFGVDVLVAESGNASDPLSKRQLKTIVRVMEQAEVMKKRFSTAGRGKIHVESLWDGMDFVSKEWSINKFEMGQLQPFLNKSLTSILASGAEHGVEMVILTGGLAKMAYVSSFVKGKVKVPVRTDVDPERAVVEGCVLRGKELWWCSQTGNKIKPGSCASERTCLGETVDTEESKLESGTVLPVQVVEEEKTWTIDQEGQLTVSATG